MELEDIPGYAQAQAWEASTRSAAFLDVAHSVCGVGVLPLTLGKLGVLIAAQNPFLCGGVVTEKAVTDLLWTASPYFRLGDVDAYGAFCRTFADLPGFHDLAASRHEIEEFLDVMFLDAPAGRSGPPKVPVTSSEAVFVDLFAEEYGWSDEKIMGLALPKLYQLLRRITLRRDPKAIFINRAVDRVRGDHIRALQAVHAAALAAGNTVETPE